jgi:RNA polymerase sigma-70 factor (ECF subfamily)
MNPKNEGSFPSTRWTLIARLKSPDAAIARRALNDLCSQYYYPLYCYIRRRGLDHDDAQDALHDFLAKLLRVHAFEKVIEERGRLRAFLMTGLRNFVLNWRRDHAHRDREVSLDLTQSSDDTERRYREEHFADADTPERIFDRKWGHELLEGVLRRLGKSYADRGRAALFDTLRPVLLTGGSLRGGDSAQLAASLAMSEGAVRVALSRLLGEYRSILEDEVLHTVESREEVDAEIGHLLGVFQAG